MDIITEKKCKKCGETKNISEFYINIKNDCLYTPCKECRKLYRSLHREDRKEGDKKYRDTHKQQRQISNKNRWNKRTEQERERDRKKAHDRSKMFLSNNPEKRVEYNNNRRASKMNAGGRGVTLEQWNNVKSEYNYLCVYCGKHKPLTIDHVVPISKGGLHDVSNIVPACGSCNSRKGNSSLLLFLYRVSCFH
jgi:5-methylcytosine-specific restriction endonuclease McrA